MELFQTLHTVWERDFNKEHSKDFFDERRGKLLTAVQEGKVVLTLDASGDIFMDCLWDTQDEVIEDNE